MQPCFLLLFRFRVLYWMQTEEQKRGRPGNEATGKNSNWPIHGSRHDESVFAQLLSGVVKDVSVVCFRVLPPGDQPLLPQGEDYLQHVGLSCITLPAVNTIGESLKRTTRSHDETTRNQYTVKSVIFKVLASFPGLFQTGLGMRLVKVHEQIVNKCEIHSHKKPLLCGIWTRRTLSSCPCHHSLASSLLKSNRLPLPSHQLNTCWLPSTSLQVWHSLKWNISGLGWHQRAPLSLLVSLINIGLWKWSHVMLFNTLEQLEIRNDLHVIHVTSLLVMWHHCLSCDTIACVMWHHCLSHDIIACHVTPLLVSCDIIARHVTSLLSLQFEFIPNSTINN